MIFNLQFFMFNLTQYLKLSVCYTIDQSLFSNDDLGLVICRQGMNIFSYTYRNILMSHIWWQLYF